MLVKIFVRQVYICITSLSSIERELSNKALMRKFGQHLDYECVDNMFENSMIPAENECLCSSVVKMTSMKFGGWEFELWRKQKINVAHLTPGHAQESFSSAWLVENSTWTRQHVCDKLVLVSKPKTCI